MTQILLNGCKYLNFAACRHISARLAGFKAKGASPWARRFMLEGRHANYRSRR
jgi:hypothetical protein